MSPPIQPGGFFFGFDRQVILLVSTATPPIIPPPIPFICACALRSGAAPDLVASLRNASRSSRTRASLIPWKGISLSGTMRSGSVSHPSSARSSQIIPDDLSASE